MDQACGRRVVVSGAHSVQSSRRERIAGDSRQPWFALIVFAFWAMTALAIWRLWGTALDRSLISPLNFLLLGLAAYRAGRVIALDEVTQPFRTPFVERWEQDGELMEAAKPEGLLGAIGALITCPDCAGFWAAGILVYAYLLWPGPVWVVTLALAVSGLGQLVNYLVDYLEKRSK